MNQETTEQLAEEKQESTTVAGARKTIEEMLADETVKSRLSEWYQTLDKLFGRRFFTLKDVKKKLIANDQSIIQALELLCLKGSAFKKSYGVNTISYKLLDSVEERIAFLKGELRVLNYQKEAIEKTIEQLEKEVSAKS